MSRDHRGAARSSQMSLQEEIIAKKREEIQARLKQSQAGQPDQPVDPPSSSTAGAQKFHKKTGVSPGAKNRW